MRAAIVGPPMSGKSTLFAAVVAASGSTVHAERPDQPHLAVVKVPDERLDWLAEQEKPEKLTYAELEFLDLPGMDLTDDAGRTRARQHWPAMRQSEVLVFCVRAFKDTQTPPYRNRIDPAGDVDELLAEMLFADLDQVASRISKLEASVKKPSPQRDAQLKELELMKRLNQAIEAEKPISDGIAGPAEEKLLRSFAFLSQRPLLAVVNIDEDSLAESGEAAVGNVRGLRLSAKIERELSELSPEDRKEFLAELGIEKPARDKLIRACYEQMNLISFFTIGPDECRAWTIPAGTDAVTAAEEIHSDIARGFIRAETVAYADLRAAGSEKAAKAAGKARLEGKNYIVQDGDVIYFRFNV